MTVDRASRPYKVIIVAPKETEQAGLDVSAIVNSFDGGTNPIDQSGIISFTGSLTLQGFPLGVNIQTNPRRDRIRWARGNKVIIYLADSAGALRKFKTLHILKEPLPPTPQTRPELAIEIGDKLSLLSFRQPPGDKSEINPGEAKTRREVVQSLLSSAKAGILLGTIPGDLNVPLQKLTNESYISQAGKIAFAGGHYLWVNRNGDVRSSPLNLDAPTSGSIVIGRDDIRYEPIQGSETPAEIIKCVGTQYIVKATPDYTRNETSTWGPGEVVGGRGRIVLSEETVEEFWAGNVRTVRTTKREPRGIVLPDVTSGRTALIPSLEQEEKYIYEASREGKLLRVERYAAKPYAVALREYYASLSEDDRVGHPATSLIAAESGETVYSYLREQTVAIESNLREPRGAILPNEDWSTGNPMALTPSGAEVQQWAEQYRNAWQAKKSTYGAIAREFPDVVAQMDADTPITGKLGVLMTNQSIVTSNSGQAQPPAPDRRKPKFTIEEKSIEAKAEFKAYAGSEFQERERVYEVPYATEDELEQAAQRLGRILNGRHLGQNFAFALGNDWLSDAPPIRSIAVTEFDGQREKFLLNNVAIAFDSRNCYLACDGIWLGSLPADEADETVTPPYLLSVGGGGSLSLAGAIEVFPYPLELEAIAGSGSLQLNGAVDLPTQPIEVSGSLNLIGSGEPVELGDIPVGIGSLSLLGEGESVAVLSGEGSLNLVGAVDTSPIELEANMGSLRLAGWGEALAVLSGEGSLNLVGAGEALQASADANVGSLRLIGSGDSLAVLSGEGSVNLMGSVNLNLSSADANWGSLRLIGFGL